jgi:hypothetical protein
MPQNTYYFRGKQKDFLKHFFSLGTSWLFVRVVSVKIMAWRKEGLPCSGDFLLPALLRRDTFFSFLKKGKSVVAS